MSVFEYQKAEENGPCLLLVFFNISQISPDCSFAFLWPGQNLEYWQSMLDFVMSPKHTALTIMLRVYICLNYGFSTLLVPLFFLSMIAIWNPKHHSQRLCLSALALQIRTASRKVTCLL